MSQLILQKSLLLLVLLIVLACTPAFAEVMDKEIPLSGLWIGTIMLSVFSFLMSNRSYWFAILVIPVLLLAIGPMIEVNDPSVGPDILREAGWIYIISAYAWLIVPFVVFIAGYLLKRKP